MALTPLEEARSHVLAACRPLDPVRLPLAAALRCVLAAGVEAAEAVPPFANTAMDGFAVRASDTDGASGDRPVALTVVGTLRAGMAPEVEVQHGQAMRIMTGAPMPPGADAVVIVERTQMRAGDSDPDGEGVVEVLEPVAPGRNVRAAGDDVEVGQTVFEVGEVLSPGHLGVLASIGEPSVTVYPPLRVGVFSTGDELVAPGNPLAPGQIRDSNRLAMLASVQEAGCDGVDLGAIPDDQGEISEAITGGALRCDALLTTGGVSMGDFDFVKVVLDRLGEMRWMQIAIKPAKPFAFGTIEVGTSARRRSAQRRQVPVFGLPGNPVSSMVSFELLARPALLKMMGHPPGGLDRASVTATADDAFARQPDGKTHFVRVVVEWRPDDRSYHARSAGAQGSHQLTAMAAANGLAILPDGAGTKPGEQMEVMLLT